MNLVRLFLLRGASPVFAGKNCRMNPLQSARQCQDKSIANEMKLYLENPTRYLSNHSALIALSIGLASLDLPVLIITIISEYLVSINEEKLFGQYPEHKNWKIAALIKKKGKEN